MEQKTMGTKASIVMVPTKQVHADKEQPRKYFDAARMHDLIESIKRLGIMNPLLVEKRDDGTYLLVDGERRFRAAQELDLKEVPVNVIPEESETERLVRQFHIQEQHASWTGPEKAKAIYHLAKRLGTNMKDLGRTLGVPERTLSTYVAFSSLIDVDRFERSEVPIKFAALIEGLKGTARNVKKEQEEELTQEEEDAIEQAVINRIKRGELKGYSDFARVKASFHSDPKAIERFASSKKSSLELYKDSKAEPVMQARSLQYACNSVQYAIHRGEIAQFEKILEQSPAVKASIRRTAELLTALSRKIA